MREPQPFENVNMETPQATFPAEGDETFVASLIKRTTAVWAALQLYDRNDTKEGASNVDPVTSSRFGAMSRSAGAQPVSTACVALFCST
jgi:hypothetical protein